MAKKVAVLTVSPVDGLGLFQHLESFLENGTPYKVFAVSDAQEIRTNSDIVLFADNVIASPKGYEDEFDALAFACDDVMPVPKDNVGEAYDIDLMEVTKAFGKKGKLMIGHCVAAMVFSFTGITARRGLAVHPLAKPAIQTEQATNGKSEVDGNLYTAQGENILWTTMSQLIEALKE